MIRSMTGFGSATLDTERLRGTVTVRSLNHRFLDVSVHLSPALQPVESEVRRLVQGRLRRGRERKSNRPALWRQLHSVARFWTRGRGCSQELHSPDA